MFVNYTIRGQHYQAGPYTNESVDSHWRDIRLYYGVTQVSIVKERDPSRKLVGGSGPVAP